MSKRPPNDDAGQAPSAAGDQKRRPPSLVVGIGASAGGLAAFKSFFDNMPANTGIAFVLVQHLDPNHPSMLPELLQPHTAMPVTVARDRARVVANHVFIIPPNATLTMEGDVLRVTTPAPPREYRRPIDTLFASLAENQEDCAVGIVLSGVGSDGSAGIKAIKDFGGLTMAQAQFDEHAMSGMPQSATATGLVDFVASVEHLPEKLLEHQAHLARVEEQKNADGVREDVKENLAIITALLRKRLKHDFSGYKQNTLIRRIQRRMQVLQIEAVSAYTEHLRRDPSEGDALFRELLIGVTQFFRDEEAFEALKTTILPALLAARPADDPVRVWVAGCATGEEVYSIATLLREVLLRHNSDAEITIFGTDIDAKAVAVARAARFRKVDGLSAERLQRWFVKDGDDYCPVAAIRDICIFSEHSLVKDPPFSKLDLVSCRNVLIYMDNDLQQRVLQLFHYALRPGAYLFLGPSESVSRASRLFDVADGKHRILQRHPGAKATLPEFQPSPPALGGDGSLPVREDRIDKGARRVMARHSPAWFVIDRHHNIQRFSGGETGRYLEPSQGSASFSLFAILAKALRSQVRRAVERAFTSGETVVDENFAFGIGGRVHAVDLIVEPIAEDVHPADLGLSRSASARRRRKPPVSHRLRAMPKPCGRTCGCGRRGTRPPATNWKARSKTSSR